jgi:hypothetical protein
MDHHSHVAVKELDAFGMAAAIGACTIAELFLLRFSIHRKN